MSRQRLYLRLVEESDLERMHRWINDPEINEIMGYLPLTMAQQRRWFESTVTSQTKFVFAVCLCETHEHIGNVGLGNIDYINRHGMLSVFIYDKTHRGKGYGTEAVKLLLDFAFRRANLHKVHLKASAFSEDALRMYRKLGFVEEGRLRQHEYKGGRYVDKVLFGMLADEYLSMAPNFVE